MCCSSYVEVIVGRQGYLLTGVVGGCLAHDTLSAGASAYSHKWKA